MTSCWPSRGVLADRLDPTQAAGRRINIDRNDVVAKRVTFDGQAAGGRGRGVVVGFARHPGVTERRQIDDRDDAVFGKLRGAKRAVGTQIGPAHSGKITEARRQAGRVEHEITGTSARRRAGNSLGDGRRPHRLARVERRGGFIKSAGFQGGFQRRRRHHLFGIKTGAQRLGERVRGTQGIATSAQMRMTGDSGNRMRIFSRNGLSEIRRYVSVDRGAERLERTVGQMEVIIQRDPNTPRHANTRRSATNPCTNRRRDSASATAATSRRGRPSSTGRAATAAASPARRGRRRAADG